MAALVLLSVEFLSLSLFTNEIFAWTAQPISPLLKTASHDDASAAKMDFAVTTAARFVLEMYGEPTPRSRVFLTAKENAKVSLRSFVVVRLFSRIILALKVSRYIAKSVLNI